MLSMFGYGNDVKAAPAGKKVIDDAQKKKILDGYLAEFSAVEKDFGAVVGAQKEKFSEAIVKVVAEQNREHDVTHDFIQGRLASNPFYQKQATAQNERQTRYETEVQKQLKLVNTHLKKLTAKDEKLKGVSPEELKKLKAELAVLQKDEKANATKIEAITIQVNRVEKLEALEKQRARLMFEAESATAAPKKQSRAWELLYKPKLNITEVPFKYSTQAVGEAAVQRETTRYKVTQGKDVVRVDLNAFDDSVMPQQRLTSFNKKIDEKSEIQAANKAATDAALAKHIARRQELTRVKDEKGKATVATAPFNTKKIETAEDVMKANELRVARIFALIEKATSAQEVSINYTQLCSQTQQLAAYLRKMMENIGNLDASKAGDLHVLNNLRKYQDKFIELRVEFGIQSGQPAPTVNVVVENTKRMGK